jgi:hypothetical protein
MTPRNWLYRVAQKERARERERWKICVSFDTVNRAKERHLMAFIMCDDHNLSVEADRIDPGAARKLMLTEPPANPNATEKEVIEFGKHHRDCNIRILAD